MDLAKDRMTECAEAGHRPLLTACADDPHSWTLAQSELLHAGRFDLTDAGGIADTKIADRNNDLAPDLTDTPRSDLSRVLQHPLRQDHQREVRSRRWAFSLGEHRKRVSRHLRKVSGLNAITDDLLTEADHDGRRHALNDTVLPRGALSKACFYSRDEIIHRPFDWSERS